MSIFKLFGNFEKYFIRGTNLLQRNNNALFYHYINITQFYLGLILNLKKNIIQKSDKK